MADINSDLESIVNIAEDEFTLLIISSIHTLKRNKKKCGRLEVYDLEQESVEFKISSELFSETLNSLIENESVTDNAFRNRECISLPKENFQETETEKQISRNNFISFKMTFHMNLMNLKLNFFTKLNHLKIIFLILHQKTQKSRNIFIRQYYVSDHNYLFQKRDTDNQLETNLESAKFKETEKIKTT